MDTCFTPTQDGADPRPSAATQDNTDWWSHIDDSDAPHSGTRKAHTLLDAYPPSRHTTSLPGRQAGPLSNAHTQLRASAHHLDQEAQHSHQPQQPASPWLLQSAPDSMSLSCEPQPGQEPGATQFQSHGSLTFRPGHRHMSDPGLDSPFTPGSRSTPGGRSTSSASAGTLHNAILTPGRELHPHADAWPSHPTRPRGQHPSSQQGRAMVQQGSTGGWEPGLSAMQGQGEGLQAVDQMFTSPEAQVWLCGPDQQSWSDDTCQV